MKNILHIDASILGENSASRALTADIVARLQSLHPDAQVTRRDLIAEPLMHLSPAHLSVFQGGQAASDEIARDVAAGSACIDELFAADAVVIGAPMYNFSVPSQLKAWFDRVSVAGRTFRYTATGFEGLVLGKKVYVASTRGGLHSAGNPSAHMDHQETYVLSQLGFLGMSKVTVIRAEGLALGDAAKADALAQARAKVQALMA